MFPGGDLIRIVNLQRTADLLTVTGECELVSQDEAALDLYITAASKENARSNTDASQRLMVRKGKGQFILKHPNPYAAMPHVTFYSTGKNGPGKPFGGIYFGTHDEAAASKRMKLSYAAL